MYAMMPKPYCIVQIHLVPQIVFIMLILNETPIFLLTILVPTYVLSLLCMPDYVLEGSKGTPFEGRDHAIQYSIFFVLFTLSRYLFHYLISDDVFLFQFFPCRWILLWEA